jgi:hypothetical protein
MERLHDLASLMRSHPDYQAIEAVSGTVRQVIHTGHVRASRLAIRCVHRLPAVRSALWRRVVG